MIRYEIREICGDWAIYEVRPDAEGEYTESEPVLILNSRANAEYIKAILEHEARYPNAAVPYRPEVADMSDEEVVAIFRVCSSGMSDGCERCPLRDAEECFGKIDERILGMAEKYLERKQASAVASDDKKKKRKKPSLAERVLQKILFSVFAVPLFLLWILIFFLRFPFGWLGKIDEVLDDAERGVGRFVSAIGEYVAAMTPECEWKYQYEKLKKRTEERNDENISD